MKANGAMNQNTEYHIYGRTPQNTPEYRYMGGVIFAALLISGAAALLFISSPVAAQGPTVTPLPGPVATATAAAAQMNQAQQAKAQAAQQAAQAQQQAAAADAQFNAAQQAANDARALIASQQVAAASEALGRSEAAIADGKATISNVLNTIAGLNSTINQQADRIVALSSDAQQARLEAQQLRVDKQTILANYTAVQARLDEQSASLTINPTTAAIVGIGALTMLLIFVMWKWSGRETDTPQYAPPDPPAAPLEGEWDVTNEHPNGEGRPQPGEQP